MKTKLTVYLDPALAKALKIAAADAGISQGDLVETATRAMLMNPKRTPSALALDALNRGPGAALELARRLRKDGLPLDGIAADLNRGGYRTAQGKRWNMTSVSRLLR